MSFKKKNISKNTFLCHIWLSSLKISVNSDTSAFSNSIMHMCWIMLQAHLAMSFKLYWEYSLGSHFFPEKEPNTHTSA